MPTSSFDKEFIITDPEALERLIEIMESDEPAVPCKLPPYDEAERKKSEELLRQFFSRFKP